MEAGSDTNVTLNLAMLTLMQKNLQGTIFGGGNPYFDIPQLLSMYKAGPAQPRRYGHAPVQAGADQRGLLGHARGS
jgi:Zn-dependent alcohol dehydrogenase